MDTTDVGVVDPFISTSMNKLGERFLGTREIAGAMDNPLIVGMLQLVDPTVHSDEIAWCSAFMHFLAFLLDIRRSGSLAARSWLWVAAPVPLLDARPGFDVVVLSRSNGHEAAPAGTRWLAKTKHGFTYPPGHVGLFAGWEVENEDKPETSIRSTRPLMVLGGNQGNRVSISPFPQTQVLGVRRLHPLGFNHLTNTVTAL